MPRGTDFNPAALRTARLRAGLTQHQLARLVGVAGGERVSRWELGTSTPRPAVLARAASILGIEVSDLLHSSQTTADLRALRMAAGLSLEDLASRLDIAKSTLSRWESGQVAKPPSRAVQQLLGDALGVSPAVVQRALERHRA